jgi:hypothetical protein
VVPHDDVDLQRQLVAAKEDGKGEVTSKECYEVYPYQSLSIVSK